MLQWIFAAALVALVSCSPQVHRISIVNHSGIAIDSAQVAVCSAGCYKTKQDNASLSNTLMFAIPADLPASNHHDVTIQVTIFLKDSTTVSSYSYNDLYGGLDSDHTITLNEQKKLEWGSK